MNKKHEEDAAFSESTEGSTSETLDPRIKYGDAFYELRQYATQNRELDSYVDACLRELAWLALERPDSTLVVADLLHRLSWYLKEITHELNVQEELEKAKADGRPVH